MKQKKKAAKKLNSIKGYVDGCLAGIEVGRELMAKEISLVLESARHLGEHGLNRYADVLIEELEENMYELNRADTEECAEKYCPEGADKCCSACECAD
ncbi:hypothetical protein [Propionivibrio sp.]|uniref:hypothetical protein n=1 Tax=Propionivibrio sp. TaxID=2212460 RepID=UPI003BF31E71